MSAQSIQKGFSISFPLQETEKFEKHLDQRATECLKSFLLDSIENSLDNIQPTLIKERTANLKEELITASDLENVAEKVSDVFLSQNVYEVDTVTRRLIKIYQTIQEIEKEQLIQQTLKQASCSEEAEGRGKKRKLDECNSPPPFGMYV